MKIPLGLTLLFCMVFFFVDGQQRRSEGAQVKEIDMRQESVFETRVPKHGYDVILVQPDQNSIGLSIVSYKDALVYIQYDGRQSPLFKMKANEPVVIRLTGLMPDSRYGYRIFYQSEGTTEFEVSSQRWFYTAKTVNHSFSFTITADSHLDQNCDTSIYKQTLLGASSDSADFHVDLGDTFMTDKYRDDYKDAFSQYIAQRYYLGLLCHSSSFFFVPGNHDGEAGSAGARGEMTAWSKSVRERYFPSMSSNNYYSWQWGDALLVVLDPFSYSSRSGADNPWDRTLGHDQYEWLKKTLMRSNAKYKFIFIHNLVGGVDRKGRARGGAEAARFFEWGGEGESGLDEFEKHRPDWEMPIHQLLKKYGVQVVYHGHDHVYAHQEYDGIVYQCLPQPGVKRYGNINFAAEYGYKNGVLMNYPGYIRVNVDSTRATIEFVSLGKLMDSFHIMPSD